MQWTVLIRDNGIFLNLLYKLFLKQKHLFWNHKEDWILINKFLSGIMKIAHRFSLAFFVLHLKYKYFSEIFCGIIVVLKVDICFSPFGLTFKKASKNSNRFNPLCKHVSGEIMRDGLKQEKQNVKIPPLHVIEWIMTAWNVNKPPYEVLKSFAKILSSFPLVRFF